MFVEKLLVQRQSALAVQITRKCRTIYDMHIYFLYNYSSGLHLQRGVCCVRL